MIRYFYLHIYDIYMEIMITSSLTFPDYHVHTDSNCILNSISGQTTIYLTSLLYVSNCWTICILYLGMGNLLFLLIRIPGSMKHGTKMEPLHHHHLCCNPTEEVASIFIHTILNNMGNGTH